MFPLLYFSRKCRLLSLQRLAEFASFVLIIDSEDIPRYNNGINSMRFEYIHIVQERSYHEV